MNLAFDRATVRSVDRDGRLHVALSNISKATVNPYRGSEIPNWQALGLNPDRVYQLLRCPAELAAAVPTFNNLPVLSEHVPVSAAAHRPELVIGSTGTDADFDGEYLQNSSVIWAGKFIAKIEDETQKEWSSAYHYVADMTPGTYKGLRYDGIMRNIVGNHVALVQEGRAGSDVVVGDSKLETASMALKSRKALLVRGSLMAYLAPKLALDAKMPDLNTVLANVTRKNYADKKPAIAAALVGLTAGKLAQDATLDDVLPHLASMEAAEDGDPEDDMLDTAPAEPAVAKDDAMSQVMAFLKDKLDADALAEVARMCGAGAMDEYEEDNADPDVKPAMDAKAIETRIVARSTALAMAREAVTPVVGKVSMALDSADKVYGFALDHLKVDRAGMHPSAFPAVFKLAAAKSAPARPLAMDSSAVDYAAKYQIKTVKGA